MRDGRVRRAWIGIAGGAAPAAAARRRARSGATAGSRSSRSSPARPPPRAGLRAEDLVVAVDDVPVRGVDDLQRLLTADHIGRRTELTVMREGRERRLAITPRELG